MCKLSWLRLCLFCCILKLLLIRCFRNSSSFSCTSGFSYSSDKLAKMRKYIDAVGDDVNLVFVVGAMAHGKIEVDYIDDFIASKFHISHLYVC
ncbi:hypothetical protein Gotri_007878 [Gossypium trilobum]|uniref:Uncharacterized protein n=1 Tax=Gossypium trilobum TaxID=34281 RepID=A0A7J9EHL4_9ROSI|nr:hypothetical protein [Gossypium trilobum]